MPQEQKGKNIGNYFGATPGRPYHLSVGVVVLDLDSNIICLHYPNIDHYADVFALPNKTVRSNETLEEAAARGAKEELGAAIEILAYLGNIVVNDTWFGELGTPRPVEKNVIYFLAKEVSSDESIAAEENVKEKTLNCAQDIWLSYRLHEQTGSKRRHERLRTGRDCD